MEDESCFTDDDESSFTDELLALEQQLGLTQSDIHDSISNVVTKTSIPGLDDFIQSFKSQLSSHHSTVDRIFDDIDDSVVLSNIDKDADVPVVQTHDERTFEESPCSISSADIEKEESNHQTDSPSQLVTKEDSDDDQQSRNLYNLELSDEQCANGRKCSSQLSIEPSQECIENEDADYEEDVEDSTITIISNEVAPRVSKEETTYFSIIAEEEDTMEDSIIQQFKNDIDQEAKIESNLHKCRRQCQKQRRDTQVIDERKRLIQNIRAAALLQRHIRSFISKVARDRRVLCSIRIQKFLRGMLARRQYNSMLLQQQLLSSATMIQRFYRGLLARRELQRLKHKRINDCATKIQTACRVKLGRIVLSKLKEDEILLSIMMIQAISRRMLQRKCFKTMKGERYQCAISIQKMIRRALQRDRYLLLKNRKDDHIGQVTTMIQRFWRRKSNQKKHGYARKLQRFYKAMKNKILDSKAVLLIQRLYRGYRVRKRLRIALSSNVSYMDSELDRVFSDEADSVLCEIMLETNQQECQSISCWRPEYPSLGEQELIASPNPIHGESSQDNTIHKMAQESTLSQKRSEQEGLRDEINSSIHGKRKQIMIDWNLSNDKVVEAMLRRREKMTRAKKREMKAKLMSDPQRRYEKFHKKE